MKTTLFGVKLSFLKTRKKMKQSKRNVKAAAAIIKTFKKKNRNKLGIESSYFNYIYRAHFCVYMVLKVSVASSRVKGKACHVVLSSCVFFSRD